MGYLHFFFNFEMVCFFQTTSSPVGPRASGKAPNTLEMWLCGGQDFSKGPERLNNSGVRGSGQVKRKARYQ